MAAGKRGEDNDESRGRVSSATSHVNIRLCVRYGGVRPVCMETKALPCWTTGVEPLVERPCLPTPWRTTLRRKDLLLLPFSLRSLIVAPLFSLPLSLSLSSLPRSHDSDSLSRRIFRLRATSINDGSARFYRQRQGRTRSIPNPFHGQRPIHFLAFDRYFRSFRYRCFFFFSLRRRRRSSRRRIDPSRISFRDSPAEFLILFFFLTFGSRSKRKGEERRSFWRARFVVSRENMVSLETCFRATRRTNEVSGIRCFLLLCPGLGGGMKGNFWSGLDRLYGV